jgi:hypothetical protein
MKCPKCKKEIKNINIISECWQKGEVNPVTNTVEEIGSIEEITETVKIEHRDNDCLADLTKIIKI